MKRFRYLKPDELVMAGDEYLAMSGEWRDVGGEMPGHVAGMMVKFRRKSEVEEVAK